MKIKCFGLFCSLIMCYSSSNLYAFPWDKFSSATKSLTARFMSSRTLSSSPTLYQTPITSRMHLRSYSSSMKEDSLEQDLIKARGNCVPTIKSEVPALGKIAGDIIGAGDVLVTYEKRGNMNLLTGDRGYLDRFGNSTTSWSVHKTKGTFGGLSPKALEDAHNIDKIIDKVWERLYGPKRFEDLISSVGL